MQESGAGVIAKICKQALKCIIAAKALYSVVSARIDGEECDRQTDRQTDRWTDIPTANSVLDYTLRGQKH